MGRPGRAYRLVVAHAAAGVRGERAVGARRHKTDACPPVSAAAPALNCSIICSTPKKRLIDVKASPRGPRTLGAHPVRPGTTCAASICAPCFSRSSSRSLPPGTTRSRRRAAPARRRRSSWAAAPTAQICASGTARENCSCAATSSRLPGWAPAASRTSRCSVHRWLSPRSARRAPRVRLRRDVAGPARPEPGGGSRPRRCRGGCSSRQETPPSLAPARRGVALRRRRRPAPRRRVAAAPRDALRWPRPRPAQRSARKLRTCVALLD